MNWGKAILGGAVGGFVVSLYNYLMHGVIMADAYTKYSNTFSQEQASPISFTLVAISIGIAGGLLFAKTRGSWGAGAKGGATFGMFTGLIALFAQFYSPLVINEFPYYLAWCWGGISFLSWIVFGTVASFIIKE